MNHADSVLDCPSTVFVLTKRATAPNNVIVGDDPAAIRFLGQQLGLTAEIVDRVTDETLVGREGLLYRVCAAHRIDVAPEIRKKTGFWSAAPIIKGSAAINALVKFAGTLLDSKHPEASRETVNAVGDILTKHGRLDDVRGALWAAAWLLSAPLPEIKLWREPWEHSTAWLDSSMEVDLRLNTLYKFLIGYGLFVTKGEEAARKVGAKPSEIRRLKKTHLDPTCVYKSVSLLSRWREGVMDSYVCAMQISAVWSDPRQ